MRDLKRSVDTLFASAVTEQFLVQSHSHRSFVIHLSCVVILPCFHQQSYSSFLFSLTPTEVL